jgi:hypothetical protein
VLLSEDDEVAPFGLAAREWRDLDVEQWNERDVGTIDSVRETALVTLRWQGHVPDDEMPIRFEDNPFSPSRASWLSLHACAYRHFQAFS